MRNRIAILLAWVGFIVTCTKGYFLWMFWLNGTLYKVMWKFLIGMGRADNWGYNHHSYCVCDKKYFMGKG